MLVQVKKKKFFGSLAAVFQLSIVASHSCAFGTMGNKLRAKSQEQRVITEKLTANSS